MRKYKGSYLIESNNSESFQFKVDLAIYELQSKNYQFDIIYSYADEIYSALILPYTEEPNV